VFAERRSTKEYKLMKGFVTHCMTALCVTSGLAVAGGCDRYRNLVDPCYPERYEYAARQEVISAFAPQVQNGHYLDQTVWNYHFEPGTERLTPGGMEQLIHLARRRPYPDCTLYLATAHDIVYDPAAPSKYEEQRANLDQRRMQAIQTYLAAETSGRHLSFEVVVHDPPEMGLAAQPMAISVGKMYLGFQGTLGPAVGTGASGSSGGGATPPSGAPPGGAPGGSAGGPPR
jgi:hypothetical protein